MINSKYFPSAILNRLNLRPRRPQNVNRAYIYYYYYYYFSVKEFKKVGEVLQRVKYVNANANDGKVYYF